MPTQVETAKSGSGAPRTDVWPDRADGKRVKHQCPHRRATPLRVVPTQPIMGYCVNISVLKSVKIHRTGTEIRGARIPPGQRRSGLQTGLLESARDVCCVMCCRDDFIRGEREEAQHVARSQSASTIES